MRDSIDNWLALLRDADAAWGLPLMAVGLVLMFMGWQFHKAAIPFSFFLAGVVIGILVSHDVLRGLMIGALIGLVLAVLSRFASKLSVAVLGGLAGAFVFSGYLSALDTAWHSSTVLTWSTAAFGFVVGTALAFIMFREMTIIVTSFLGALMIVSGLNAVLPQYAPTMYATLTSFLADYPALLVPFLVGGPTLIGALYQLAAANRPETDAE